MVFTSATGALWGRHGLWGSANGSDPVNMYDEARRYPDAVELAGTHRRHRASPGTGECLRFHAIRL
ncbi:MAG: hypothetical protein WDO73_26130 [Ignavibacteriota bacterium]